MVVAIALVEGWIVRNDHVFIEKTPASWQFSVRKSREDGKRVGILCLGSSLTKFGIHPALIQRKTGRSCFNLGVYGGRAASSFFLLENVLARGGRPEAVVLDFHEGPVPTVAPRSPNHDIWTLQRDWEELLTLPDCIDLSIRAGDPTFLASTLVGVSLPSTRGRQEIRHELSDALAGQSGSSRPSVFALQRNWNLNRGAQVMAAARSPDQAEPAPAATNVARDDWINHRLLDVYARRFMELSQRHGVRVFWILPPLSATVRDAEERSGYVGHYESFAREMLAKYPALVLLDARNSGYGPDVFYDATHLNEAGMVTFSEDVAEAIRDERTQSSDQTRWRTLPRYRPRSAEITFENLDQSRSAILARSKETHSYR